jgi:hypothetical protein
LRAAYSFIKQLTSLGANIASASSITPPSTGSSFNITGTTAITAIASTESWDGRIITLIFAGALTLTHSANLALPGSVNITTAANDSAIFIQTGSGAWRLLNYQPTSGALTVTDFTATGITTLNGPVTLGDAIGDTIAIGGGSSKSATGNWVFAAPSSGYTVSVAGSSGIAMTTSGTTIDFTNTGGNVSQINYYGSVFMELLTRNAAAGWKLYVANAVLSTTWSSAGNVTIAAPTAGVGFTQTGFAGSNAANFNGGSSGTFSVTTTGGATTNENIRATGASSTIGYGTGSGGSATQITSRATGISLSKATGRITLFSANLASLATDTFTWTNTLFASGDVVVLEQVAGNLGAYAFGVIPSTGQFWIKNTTAAGINEAPIFDFVLIKGVAS